MGTRLGLFITYRLHDSVLRRINSSRMSELFVSKSLKRDEATESSGYVSTSSMLNESRHTLKDGLTFILFLIDLFNSKYSKGSSGQFSCPICKSSFQLDTTPEETV